MENGALKVGVAWRLLGEMFNVGWSLKTGLGVHREGVSKGADADNWLWWPAICIGLSSRQIRTARASNALIVELRCRYTVQPQLHTRRNLPGSTYCRWRQMQQRHATTIPAKHLSPPFISSKTPTSSSTTLFASAARFSWPSPR